jgi:hypothetical protein
MLAYRRADVRDLNDAAHTLMLRAGRLGSEAVEFGGREFRIGDRVLCRRNDTLLGIRNGTRATITALDNDALTLRADTGSLRVIPHAYAAEHLEHGYALTGHAAQGTTLARAYILLPDRGALQEWGYVACTRARTETRLYLAERDPLEHETPLRGPNPAAAPNAPPVPSNAGAAPSHSPLNRPGAERMSVPNLHARQQQGLERQRARAAERLATAQRELKELGWRNRLDERQDMAGER